jgi:uncharacterized protein YhaN
MRFDRIDLIKYGPFTNASLVFPTRIPDFHIIYGDNEAGKSTALRGVTGLLFGIPVRTSDTFLHQANQLRIGAVVSSNGQYLEFRRRKGTKQTLLDGNEQALPDGAIGAFLREVDLERFKRFYGIDHQMLRDGGNELLEGKGDVGKTLFEVAGLLDLRGLLANLEAQAGELFGGRTKVINVALTQYTEARADKVKTAISREQFESLQRQLEETQLLLEQRRQEAAASQEQLVRLRRIKGNKPDLAKLATARAELLSLENVPELEKDARQKRERAQAGITETRKHLDKLQKRIERRRDELSALPVYTGLDKYVDAVADLNQQTGQYRKNIADEAKRQRESEAALQNAIDHWRRTFPDRSIDEAESLRPLYGDRAEILSMVASHGKVEALQGAVRTDFDKATQDRGRLTRELEKAALPPDSGRLVAAIEEARKLGDAEERQRKLQAEAEKILATASKELHALRAWHRSLEDLETASLPLPSTVDRYADEWGDLENVRKERRTEIGKQLEAVRTLETKLVELRAQGEVPTAADLAEARRRRDELWCLIRGFAFDGSFSKSDAEAKAGAANGLAAVFEVELRQADDLADQRFSGAQTVIQRELLNLQIEDQRQHSAEIEEELQHLGKRFAEMRARWTDEWPGFGAAVLPPKEMQEWCRQRSVILDRVAQSRDKTSDAALIGVQIAVRIEELSTRLGEVGAPPAASGESLGALLARTSKVASDMGTRRQTRERLERELELCEERLTEANSKLSKCEDEKHGWKEKWDKTTNRLGMPGATPARIETILSTLENVFRFLDQHGDLEHRVLAMGEDIAEFAREVDVLVSALDANLSNLRPDAAVAELQTRVLAWREATTKRTQLVKQIHEDEEGIAERQQEEEEALAQLVQLRQKARCNTDQDLELVEEQFERKRQVLTRVGDLERNLIERNAASLEAIAEEAAAYELDQLDAEVERLECQAGQLTNDVVEASTTRGELKNQLQAMEGAEASAEAAQRSEEALATIRQATEDYVRLRLSIEVLRRAIESYRERHQAPILRRASEIFREVTLGEHRDLATDFDDKDSPVLVSVRRNGERVPMEGLSDGTRDQLYLALRLAAIEMHVSQFGSVPVILDDILINSDDHRADATLRQLASLGRNTQVLFFTHHQHLVSLARKVDANVLELARSTSGNT